MSTTCGRPLGLGEVGVDLKWMHVDGGLKTGFSCGCHKWMTPNNIEKVS